MPKSLVRDTGLDALWVAALAILQILFVAAVSENHGEPYEWAQYLLLGTLFPALLVAISFGSRRLTEPLQKAGIALLAAAGFGLSLFFGIHRVPWIAPVAAALQWGAVRLWSRPAHWFESAIEAGILFLGWLVAFSVIWWVQGSPTPSLLHPLTIAVLAGSLVALIPGFLFSRAGSAAGRGATLARLAISCVVLGYFSFRTDILGDPRGVHDLLHHWGAYVGPAEVVRRGGWLLWDTPSQYGFLSTLLIAALPFKSVWNSLYFANASFLFAYALLLGHLWSRALGRGWGGYALSLLLTLIFVFLAPGWIPAVAGPYNFPSVSAFRFFFACALLALLARECWLAPERRFGRAFTWGGSALWLAGTLWSFESALYCTAVWFSGGLWARARSGKPHALRGGLLGLARNLALLAVAIGLIDAFYLARLGHLPEWRAFAEYVLSFQGGFGALPIDPAGAVRVLLWIFFLFSAWVLQAIHEPDDGTSQAASIGAWVLLAVTSSYFIGRSSDNNIDNLFSVFGFCIAAVCIAGSAAGPTTEKRLRAFKLGLLPVLCGLFAVTFGNPIAAALYVDFKPFSRQIWPIESVLPPLLGEHRALIAQAKLAADAPLIYVDTDAQHLNMMPPMPGAAINRPWLPTLPLTEFIPLPAERSRLYLSRFISHHCESGWVLSPKSRNDLPLTWLFDQLSSDYTVAERFEAGEWQLERYQLRPGVECASHKP